MTIFVNIRKSLKSHISGSSVRMVLKVLSFVIVAVFVPLLGTPAFSNLGKPAEFDPKPAHELKKINPRIVLIGNSLLRTRIHPRVLGKAVGQKVGLIAQHGSMSARWYLFMKNYLPAIKAEKVVIFFRGDELTKPRYRADGRYRTALESAMRGEETVLSEILKKREHFSLFYTGLENFYPLLKDSYRVQENARSAFLKTLLGENLYTSAYRYQKPFFELNKLRRDVKADDTDNSSEKAVFEDVVESSFLPEMVKLSKAGGYKLIFFRVKTRSHFEKYDSPRQAAYVQSLEKYLARNGAKLVDESGAKDIPVKYYSDGDHIATRHRRAYTRIFAARIKEVLLDLP